MHRSRNIITITLILMFFVDLFSLNVYSADEIPIEVENPDEQECVDIDQDNYFALYCGGLDCNDNDKLINPKSLEICGNEIDENCDGIIEQCIIDDLRLINVIYSGDLVVNKEIKFNLEYVSNTEVNKAVIKIDDEIYNLDLTNGTEFNYTFVEGGEYLIKFILDPEDEIQEVDENNNEFSLTLNIKGIYLCDFQNEITGCVICSCKDGEICSANGECTELENSPILPEITSVSFFPSDYQNYIFVNGQRILEKNEYASLYFHNDFVGSLAFTTDENGNKNNEILYFPFGEYDEKLYGRGFFSGKELDDSGLYYFGARYYDSSAGRFTQVDPIRDEKSSSYNYVSNNPFKYVDPDGREKQDARKTNEAAPEVIKYGEARHAYPVRTSDPSKANFEMAKELWNTLSIIHYSLAEGRQARIAEVAAESTAVWGSLERNFNLQTPESLSNKGKYGEITVLEKAIQVFEQVQPPAQLSEGMSDYEIMLNKFVIVTGTDGTYIAEKYENGKASNFYKMTEGVEKAYVQMQRRLNPQIYDTSIVDPGNEASAPDATSVKIVIGEDNVK